MQPDDPSNGAAPETPPHDTAYGDCTHLPGITQALYEERDRLIAERARDAVLLARAEERGARMEEERDRLLVLASRLTTKLSTRTDELVEWQVDLTDLLRDYKAVQEECARQKRRTDRAEATVKAMRVETRASDYADIPF